MRIQISLLVMVFFILSAFIPNLKEENEEEKITWYTIEEVEELVKEDPKMVFIDVYTDWCGWCKRMDATTFSDPEVAKEMNEHFYAVKFDGEDKNTVNFRGQDFKFVASGRNGYNELAAALLQGKLSYPTVVFLDENLDVLQPLPGYRTAEQFLPILKYLGEEHYKDTKWEDYVKSYGK